MNSSYFILIAEGNKEAAILNAEGDKESLVLRATAEKEAQIAKAEGQAEAEAARLKVAAGLSPAERAEWDYKTKVGVAEALSKTKWPTVVMSGNSGQNTAMDVIALKQMTDLVDKMSK